MTIGGCKARASRRPAQRRYGWLVLSVSYAAKVFWAAVILALPAGLHAQFAFVTNNGAITITKYTGPGGYVVIPSFTNSRPITMIGSYAFWGMGSLTGISIPSSITNIQDYAFGNTGLLNVTVPGSVTTLGAAAFGGCSNLTTAVIANGVVRFSFWAFEYCVALTNISLPATLANIPTDMFDGCTNLLSLTIPNSVTNIEPWAFNNCYRLNDVTFGNHVASIGISAFMNCFSLTNAILPESLRNIDYEAFYGCSRLREITTSTNLDLISDYAFAGCTNLVRAFIGRFVTNIGMHVFWGCSALVAITVDEQNRFYSSINGVLFTKSQDWLLTYPQAKSGSFTVPSSVVNLPEYAFAFCPGLTSVYFTGDAPVADSYPFSDSINAVIYYLPGTSGWEFFISSAPKVLWNPQIQVKGPNFGVRSNQFGFTIVGTPNIPILLEACTNLGAGVWLPVETNILTNGLWNFREPAWINYYSRYYRIRGP